MSEYAFPEKRFVAAGVPQSDIDQMRRSFNTSDLSIQRARCEFWGPIPQSALLDYVQTLRDNGEITSDVLSESSESTPDVDSDDSDVEDDEDDTKGDSETSEDDSHDED